MATVAVLGTGIMGAPIARNLARAGHEVRVWNRTAAKAEALAGEERVAVARQPAEAAEGADFLLTMLADADAVLQTAGDATDAFDGGMTWLQMSTIGIEGTERCAALAAERELTLIDAPVLGTKAPAEAGELVVLASGPELEQDRCAPVFDVVGRRTVWLGDAGAGTRLKLVANLWVVSLVEALAETLALAEGLAVDPRQFLDVIAGGPLDAGYAQAKGRAMLEDALEPAFPLKWAAKDAALVAEAAERHGLDLPLPRAIGARMADGVAAGHGDADMAATFRTSRPR